MRHISEEFFSYIAIAGKYRDYNKCIDGIERMMEDE